MKIIGIDGGLSHMGVTVTEITSPIYAKVLALKTIETERSDKKRAVRESEDVVRRAREVWAWLELEFHEHPEIRVLCMETLSLPRNAGSSAKIGVAFGIVVACASARNLPIVQASPQEVKKKIAGVRDASKDDVEKRVRAVYPTSAPFLDAMRKKDREHAADAVAIVHACLDSDVVRAAATR